MSENTDFGFARLVPGFDFLQNLAKGATHGMPQMPSLSSWIAPTLNVEELDKRIAELKTVQFWLDQNGKALAATIQALEVQKMTLATLQGMNVQMSDMAEALRMKPAPAPAARGAKGAPAPDGEGPAKAGPEQKAAGAGAAAVDPLQWWGALTQQFQEIAAGAMKDVAQKAASDTARTLATGKKAMQAAGQMAAQAVSSIPTGVTAAAAPAKKASRGAAAKKPAAEPAAAGKPAPRKRAAKAA
jgi:hypothetical protein